MQPVFCCLSRHTRGPGATRRGFFSFGPGCLALQAGSGVTAPQARVGPGRTTRTTGGGKERFGPENVESAAKEIHAMANPVIPHSPFRVGNLSLGQCVLLMAGIFAAVIVFYFVFSVL